MLARKVRSRWRAMDCSIPAYLLFTLPALGEERKMVIRTVTPQEQLTTAIHTISWIRGSLTIASCPITKIETGTRGVYRWYRWARWLGKTALLLSLCRKLREKYNIAVVTNDIFTREDQEFLRKHSALSPESKIRLSKRAVAPTQRFAKTFRPTWKRSNSFKPNSTLSSSSSNPEATTSLLRTASNSPTSMFTLST